MARKVVNRKEKRAEAEAAEKKAATAKKTAKKKTTRKKTSRTKADVEVRKKLYLGSLQSVTQTGCHLRVQRKEAG